MRARRRAMALAGVALVLASSREASAYCRTTTCDPTTEHCEVDDHGCVRTGAPLSWHALPIVYRFQAAGSEKLDPTKTREVVRRAFDTWSNATCGERNARTSLRFEEGSDIAADKAEGAVKATEPFGIYFRDAVWTHDDADESLALTNQLFGKVTGRLDYSDIEINSHDNDFALADSEKGIDLQSVVTHEVGHYIGLSHSKATESIMVARYCQSGARCSKGTDTMRGLSEDDTTAVCALYPPSGIGGVHFDPEAQSGGCAAARVHAPSPSPSAASAAQAALAFAALAFARRRRTS